LLIFSKSIISNFVLRSVNVLVSTSGNSSASVSITVFEKGSANVAATGSGNANAPITFTVPSPKLWSPESPNLYDVAIKLGNDSVSSYTGFRSISRGAVNSVQRILLNGQVVLPFGTLDQGYWPDGIYTPPTYEAMVFDLQTLKKLGMNMVRKHVSTGSILLELRSGSSFCTDQSGTRSLLPGL
jgi:beta-galactosidase/beta-glucuronidase